MHGPRPCGIRSVLWRKAKRRETERGNRADQNLRSSPGTDLMDFAREPDIVTAPQTHLHYIAHLRPVLGLQADWKDRHIDQGESHPVCAPIPAVPGVVPHGRKTRRARHK